MSSYSACHKHSFLHAASCAWLAPIFIMVGVQAICAATITGTVSDSVTGALLSGVAVQPVGSFDQVFTDDQGKFSLTVDSITTVTHGARLNSVKTDFRLAGRGIIWHAATGMNMRLYNLRGELLDKYSAGPGAGAHSLPPLTNGIFLLESLLDGCKHFDKLTAQGNSMSLLTKHTAILYHLAPIAKAASVTTMLDFTLDNYSFKQVQVNTSNMDVKLVSNADMYSNIEETA
jgi:hypothetical protein